MATLVNAIRVSHHDSKCFQAAGTSPELSIGATVTLAEAEKVGLDRAQLLRVVSGGRVPLYYRVSGVEGYVVAADDLYYDPVTGGRDIPTVKSMPHGAFESTQSAVLQLTDSASIANVILVDATPTIELVAFVVSYQPEKWFIPNVTVIASVEALEVSSNAVALIRGHMVAHIPERERQQLSALPQIELASKQAQGAKADVLFSRAVEVYCSDPSGLPNVLESTAEQRQRKKSMLYFAEYMGDLPIGEITSDLLRQFRDGPLRTFPANANHLPRKLVRTTMKETIQAIKDSAEVRPVLSQASQAERMAYLFNLFSWLHKKEWLARNPAASLKGESGLSKAERRTADQRIRSKSQDDDEEGRQPFTPEELVSIFAQPQYQTGDGRHITKGNQSWAPFEYWLPLLGLYAGCRIGEVSQLHLNDVREIDGVWALDINDYTKDKRVKTKETSIRRIPLHPKLIELGFLEYCDLLRGAGFQRVFGSRVWSLFVAS